MLDNEITTLSFKSFQNINLSIGPLLLSLFENYFWLRSKIGKILFNSFLRGLGYIHNFFWLKHQGLGSITKIVF